jgi:hypothetical protein
MVNPNRFYTYAYLREDGTPYYIGKGCGNRAYKRKKGEINLPKDKSRIIFLKQNLTEEEAFKHEKYMIAVFGRKDLGTGILRNKTDGGDGSSGAVVSEETRRKQSEKRKGENNYWYGKKGEQSCWYGKKHTKETKDKIRKSNTGREFSKEHRENISQSKKGENNYWYGRKHSQETREKMKKSAKRGETHHMYGKTHTEETRDKMSKSQKGRPSPKGMLGKKHTEEAKQKMSENREVKSFSVISPTGEIIHSKNAKQFCRDNNLDKGHFSQVLNGKRQSHKGFRLYRGEDT